MVLPIVAVEDDGNWNAIGASAVIAAGERQALLVTARHNLEHIRHIDRPRSRSHPSTPPEFRLPEQPIDTLRATRAYALYDRDACCSVCEIGRWWFSTNTDVAYALINLDQRTVETATTFRLRLALNTAPPKVGDLVHAIAYQGFRATACTEDQRAAVEFQPTWRNGTIVAIHLEGSGICTWPCFETDIPLDSGMSGGPIVQIVEGTPLVRGVMSSDLSLDPSRTHAGSGTRSMVTMIWPSLGTVVDAASGDLSGSMEIVELIRRGVIDDHGNSPDHFRRERFGNEVVLLWNA